MENCIFCKIVRGEIPAVTVWEDAEHVAFLDINPNTKGMTVVIPKKHYDSNVFEMPEAAYCALLIAVKKTAELLQKGLKVKRVGMVMEGLGVNHAHIKLYPMHGLSEDWQANEAPDRVYFESYPGYITTKMGPQRTLGEIKMVKETIIKNIDR